MKNSENNKLDQLLKDQLAEGSAKVPDFVWDRIEEELFPEKKRRFFLWWWLFGGIGVLLVSCLVVLLHSESANPQHFERTQKQYAQQKSNVSDQEPGIDRKSIDPAKSKHDYAYRTEQENDNSQKASSSSPNTVSSGKTSGSVNTPGKSKSAYSYSKTKIPAANQNGNNSSASGAVNPSNAKNSAATNSSQPTKDPMGTDIQKNDLTDPDEAGKTPAITEVKPKTDSVDYTHILEMLKNRFPAKIAEEHLSPFSIGIYGGPSFYDIAVFKDYFTSGQLSNRTFTSSGFEAGFNARFKMGDRFSIYSGLAFNQKQSQFRYNVAITQTDYFTNVINGNKIPLANIVDNGVNSCFLAKDVTAKYNISSTLLSLGTTYEFWRSGRFSAAADLRFSYNIQTAMQLKEMTVLDIQQPQSERFSYFQPGLGVLLNLQLSKRISVGLSPMFSKQFYTKESFTKKANELVVPVTIGFRF